MDIKDKVRAAYYRKNANIFKKMLNKVKNFVSPPSKDEAEQKLKKIPKNEFIEAFAVTVPKIENKEISEEIKNNPSLKEKIEILVTAYAYFAQAAEYGGPQPLSLKEMHNLARSIGRSSAKEIIKGAEKLYDAIQKSIKK